jgi:FMN reductase
MHRDSQVSLLAVVGSVTAPGRLRRAVAEGVERAGRTRLVSLVDLAEQKIGFADGRPPEAFGDDTAAVVGALDRAEAVLLATPTYRGSMTGSLKNLLDQVPLPSLRGKPVGIVAMGVSRHHYLGADRHLRDVLGYFGALVTPVSVYLTAADFVDGAPSTAAAEDVDGVIAALDALRAIGRGVADVPAPLVARAKDR